MITLHVGFDDTDSPRMGCTTYVAALLVERLHELGASFVDYPNLVRLNPNVPWKTRGNGALCLRIRCDEDLLQGIKEVVLDTIEENADLSFAGTDPGVVFFVTNRVPQDIRTFAKRTIQGVVKMKKALELVKAFGAEAVGFKTGRGIIGGLAAVGETLEGDHTYELIAYRTRENCGTPRRLDASSVVAMNEKMAPLTFNNLDCETQRILITPRGPDPILYGIRGETPTAVWKAHEMVGSLESVERWVVFRTNHGTDAHLQAATSVDKIRPYNPTVVRGTVSKAPYIVPRRHVIFSLKDETGTVDCAAYEPTGTLRRAAKALIVGDMIEAYGGVRPTSSNHPVTVNLEKLRILNLAPKLVFHNPLCPKCGRRMESMGKDQGFRCARCGIRSSELKKQVTEENREVEEALYVTSPRSQRHLTKPLCRYGREKSGKPATVFGDWHFP